MIIIIKRLGELGTDPIKNAMLAIQKEEKLQKWNNKKSKGRKKGCPAWNKGKHADNKKRCKKVCSRKSKTKSA